MLDKNLILERTRELVVTSGISYAALADRCGVNEKLSAACSTVRVVR